MEIKLICTSCGNIRPHTQKEKVNGLRCESCGTPFSWNDSFPPLTAHDMMRSVISLFKSAKENDKKNLSCAYDYLREEDINLDKTLLDKYKNRYERMLEKYPYNDDAVWVNISDEFIDELSHEFGEYDATLIYAALRAHSWNEYRKPCLIMMASVMEQLFNDYFFTLVSNVLSPSGAEAFLKKYENAGIQSAIDIADSFLDDSLRNEMAKYSSSFFDKWETLRRLRNRIIHDNKIYISKNKLSDCLKITESGFDVFASIKADIYKE